MYTTVELKLQTLCNFTFYIVEIKKDTFGCLFFGLININVEMILQHTHTKEKYMSNKNAYELRTDILSMAQSRVMDIYNQEFSVWDMSCERHPDTGVLMPTTTPPTYPTTSEILKTANELYSFVEAGRVK